MGFRADLWPTTKPTYVLLIFVAGVALAIGLLIMSVTLYRDIDLYQHGKIEQGAVKSIQERTERGGKGKSSFVRTIFIHTISYAGMEMQFESRAELKKGSAVSIYYSTENPSNAVVKAAEHPFRKLSDVFSTNGFCKVASINILLYLLCWILVIGYRRAKPQAPL